MYIELANFALFPYACELVEYVLAMTATVAVSLLIFIVYPLSFI